MEGVGKNTNVIVDGQSGYDIMKYRYKFEDIISEVLKPGDGKDRCHYISFSYLKESLAFLAGELKKNNITQADFNHDIDVLTYAVLIGEDTPGLSEEQSRKIQNIYYNVENYRDSVKRGTSSNSFLRDINLLLYYLNSVDKNLRIGNKSWNQSIGNYYDPDRWLFAGENGRLQSSNISYNIMHDIDYGGDEEVYASNTFYLVSQVDIDKLDAAYCVKKVKPIKMFTAEYLQVPMMYSSNNLFALESDGYKECRYTVTRL